MKNIVTLTAILIAHSLFSQITPTKEQQKKIQEVTTPERLIEYSKGLSNEKRQYKIIDSLQNELKKKDLEIVNLIKQHTRDLIEIGKNNNTIADSNRQIDEVQNEEENKNFRKILGLDATLEFPEFQFEKPQFNLDLLLDLKHFKIGLRGNALYGEESRINYSGSLILRYSFF